MQIAAPFKQTFESEKKFFVALGVINATGRQDQFSTLTGVFFNPSTKVFDFLLCDEGLNHVGGRADRR